MPRFQLGTLLIVTAIVALWLSTFTGYGAARDVRSFIILGSLVTSGVAAFSCSGHRRAFWLGFFGTLLGVFPKATFLSQNPLFRWTDQSVINLTQYIFGNALVNGRLVDDLSLTFTFVLTLIAATVIGLLSVYVYDQASKR